MANGKIRFGKQSGGQLALVIPDGVANTEVVVPESGTLVSVGTAVTDNAVVRFDGNTSLLKNSNVFITDDSNLLIGTSTDNGVDKLQVNGSISYNRRNGSRVGETIDSRTIASNAATQLGTLSIADRAVIV